MKNSFGFTWYLAGLSMLGYLAMDMYLPAFGAMGEQLQIGAGAVGASLSISILFFPANFRKVYRRLQSCSGLAEARAGSE